MGEEIFYSILFLINEKINCENMMKFAKLPYHAIIEIIGMILFITLAYIFLKSDNSRTAE